MASLQHPSVVSIHDLGIDDNKCLFLLMEEVEGKTMKEYIQTLHKDSNNFEWAQTQWGFRRIVDAFYRVCETMAYVHDNGIVHLDLKPSNIQLWSRGQVWILDWGLARNAGGKDEEIWCSPYYSAPERTVGIQSGACDVYALGTILFEILVGIPPFYKIHANDIIKELERNNTPAVSKQAVHQRHMPAELVSICEHAMKPNPEQRPSVDEFVDVLRSWLDGNQKKSQALELVRCANEKKSEITQLSERCKNLTEKITILSNNLPKLHSIESNYPIWDLEQEILNASERKRYLMQEYILLLRQAISTFPNTYEALEPLIEHFLQQHQEFSKVKDFTRLHSIEMEAQSFLTLLPVQHDTHVKVSRYFRGEELFEIQLPPNCSVILETFEVTRKRRQAKFVDTESQVSDFSKQLPVGSYRIRILHPDYCEVHYPFYLEYGKPWSTSYEFENHRVLPLPETDSLKKSECYVPEGWFYAGGDPEAPNSLPEQRVWIDGFVISRTPVTHGQYLLFLNDILDKEGLDSAMRFSPREQASKDGSLGTPVYLFKDGRIVHPKGSSLDNHPVVQITWCDALCYTKWFSQQTGQKWRLPMELEWEKTARGVDRRYFPWGDMFDPNFCNMMDSFDGSPEIKSVDHQPLDVSIYGALSCAGNTREWCLDKFNPNNLPIEDGRAVYPSQEDLDSTDFKSSRGGSFGNASTRTRSADRDWWFPQLSYIGRGFRVARSWPPTEESDKLHVRIAVAIQQYKESLSASSVVD